uniref:Floricaula/leafy-like transcription factor n=1 Tax=Silene coeli-rosa TaxID=54811 RepID=Q8RW10_9CARY|nr:putative LFY transcription factor [Silene coeli-rosa]
MDQDPFTASLFKWDYPRGGTTTGINQASVPVPPPQSIPAYLARGLLASGYPGVGMGMGMGMSMQGISMANSQLCGGSSNNNVGNNSNNNNGGLEELFQAYGIRYFTAAKIAEMGFTVNTLVDMKEEELEDMMNSLSHLFRWDLLVGERYGIKAAIRAERRRLDDLEDSRRHRHHNHHNNNLISYSNTPPHESGHHPLDALSQEGLSEEAGVHEKEVVVSGGGGGGGGSWEMVTGNGAVQYQQRKKRRHPPQQQQLARKTTMMGGSRKGLEGRLIINNNNNNNLDDEMDDEDEVEDDDLDHGGGGGGGGGVCVERQREHPFIVTEPGEVARGKKNGLDYLFHLYEQCREFLLQVQNISKDRGEKCPTKVTNQVFRFAKKAGATYINKPKMRHYVHCYALHCLEEDTSNALRRAFKERGENVGAWRQACYKPLVAIAGRQGWDIDSIFNSHPRLSIWYVPTKLRQLCHAERSSSSATSIVAPLPF